MRFGFTHARRKFLSSLDELRHVVKPGIRELSEAERREVVEIKWEGIRRALASRTPAKPVEPVDPRMLAYVRLWRATKGAAGELAPPVNLDPSIPEHVTFALSVVGDYDAAREQPGEFGDCLYRPASDLPYPPDGIRRCCELLIRIADADRGAFADRDLLIEEREALGLALFSLDYFLEMSAAEIPRKKLSDGGLRGEYESRKTPEAKPNQGDVIVRGKGAYTDEVAEIIGVNEKNEWMVVSRSGSSIQVARTREAGTWEEVNEIVAAAVSWLSLTPSSGMPKL
jgi:hypothetical protein